MVVIGTCHNAPKSIINKLKEHVGDSEFESLPHAINRLEEIGIAGHEIGYCVFIPI